MSDFARLMEAAREAGAAISAPEVVDLPAITGTGLVGEVLTCGPGVWTNAPTDFAYAWRSDMAPIATGDVYTVAAGDVGHSLDCAVTASNAAGAGTAVSAALVVTGTREAPGEPPAEAKVEAEAKEKEPERAPAHERGARR
jgi:hypothetical protein